MLAYKNDQALKDIYVARAIAHRKADEIVQGYGYWKKGKGCNIGCLAHADSNAHFALEKQIGYPKELNHLADRIFEGLPADKFKEFPEQYAGAAKPGADLSLVTAKFIFWLLTEEIVKYFDTEKFPEIAASCKEVAGLYSRKLKGEVVTNEEWVEARKKASAYAADAADAADAAAYADAADAADAAAADADADAADADAADAAAYAAYAADAAAAYAAADAAAYAAAYAAADAAVAYADVDAAAARKKCYARLSEKLLEIMTLA